MWEIRCDADLMAIKEGMQVSGDMMKVVEHYYEQLREASFVPNGDDFHLECGHIVVIDPVGDDWRGILEVDQPYWIEYVESIALPNGTQVYRVARMLDNEMLMTYFLQAEVNQEADEWLQEYV